MREFMTRFDRPLLTDLWLGWEGVAVQEVYPTPLPDMHEGESLFVSARLAPAAAGGAGFATLQAGDALDRSFALTDAKVLPAGTGLALRWARTKIASLMDGLHGVADPEIVREQVVALALEYNLVTRYTSLVATELRPVVDEPGSTTPLPNNLPQGSTLLDGAMLPRGGTALPLRRALGLGLTGLALLLVLFHAARRR